MLRRVAIAGLLATACTDSPDPPSGPEVTSVSQLIAVPLQRRFAVDVLFVVDTSPGFAPHREALLANSRTFMTKLGAFFGGLPDLHIGVVSADVGTRGPGGGPAPTIGDCAGDGDAGVMHAPANVTGNVIEDRRTFDGARDRNYTGTLADTFADAVAALPTGCSFPRPLEAMRRALQHRGNAGFLRRDAALAVIVISAHDDCSFQSSSFLDGATPFRCVERADELVPVAEYVGFLRALRGDRIIVSGAFGAASPFSTQDGQVVPACTVGERSAEPGRRLQAFLDGFARPTFTSLCESDLSGVVSVIANLDRVTLGAICLPSPPIECNAWIDHDVRGLVIDRRASQTLPVCGDTISDAPCYRMRDAPATCTQGGPMIDLFNAYSSSDSHSRAIFDCLL
jgi:hypothetical protein